MRRLVPGPDAVVMPLRRTTEESELENSFAHRRIRWISLSARKKWRSARKCGRSSGTTCRRRRGASWSRDGICPKDEMVAWWRILNNKGWGVSHWPKEYGGTGLDLGAALYLQRGAADASGAGAARLRRQHGRSRHLHLRQRGAEEAIPAAHRQCRRLVVPGIFRAGLGLRPRLAEDQGRAQGRQVHRQRPEDLDHARPARRHDLLPVPHRSEREEADRHLLHPHRHEEQGHHGAADRDHRRRP